MTKTMKKGLALTLAAVMATTCSNTISNQKFEAFAAENLQDNESVQYAYVSDEDGLRTFIDNDGAFSSQDSIAQINGYSDVHKIEVTEPGTLYVYSGGSDYLEIQMFSNFSLTAMLAANGNRRAQDGDRGNFCSYELKKGTYYYRMYRWNGHGSEVLTSTTYLGFKPASGKMNTKTSSLSKTEDTAKLVEVPTVKSPTGLIDYINNDGAEQSKGYNYQLCDFSEAYKFTVTEPGWLYAINLQEEGAGYVDWKVYSNKDMTSNIYSARTTATLPEAPSGVYLEPGTYYYRGYRWNGHGTETYEHTTYLGFMPSKQRISVNKVTLSKDKTYATVTFNYDKNYLESFLKGTIRVVKGKIPARLLEDSSVWATSTKENALSSNSMKVTSNGTYTARIAANEEGWCMTSFKVSGIVKAPAMPKITVAKKQTKIIKGTSAAKMKVVVKYNGKTYTTTANKNGVWTVKVKGKLASKKKITAYAQNTNGAKSKVRTFTVK